MNQIPKNINTVSRVAEQLRAFVTARCQLGEALPPVRQLASEMGVSPNTLRAAQSLLAQEGYVNIRPGSGVYVNQRAITKCVAIYSELDLLAPRMSWYYRGVARGLRSFFREHCVDADIFFGQSIGGEAPSHPTSQFFLNNLISRGLDGVVFLDEPNTKEWVQWQADFTLPAVGNKYDHHVNLDYHGLLQAGVESLIAQGCSNLALLAWGQPFETFEKCLACHGLDFRPEWMRNVLDPSFEGGGWEEFREIWSAHTDKPDGLLILDDLLAVNAARAITEMRIEVPKQLRLVTHSNKGSGINFPFPVTRLQVDPEEAAKLMGTMLLDLIAARPVAEPRPLLSFRVIPPVDAASHPCPRQTYGYNVGYSTL